MTKAIVFLFTSLFAQAQDLSQLSFLTGCWSLTAGPMVIEEEWGRPADGLLGFSRNLKDGKTVFVEFMRIDKQGTTITYTPRIGTRQGPVTFTMTKLTADEVIFENPANDFPQRILYKKVPGGLAARIDGKKNGKESAQDFPYKKVACEAR